jgi:pimeloyl-ACP methyl ester carboxylesterase
MSPRVEGPGVELAYEERGSGPPVVLVHGMADDRRGWAATMDALAPEARVIAFDRRGYGESEAPEAYERTSIVEQTEDAVALMTALDAAPAVVVGADLGTLVCLDLLVRHPDLVAGAVLLAPALYAILPGTLDDLAAQRVALEEVLRDRGPEATVVAYLAGAAAERIERARGAHRAFFADYGGLPTFAASRRELAAIAHEVVVLEGQRPESLEASVATRLADLLPGARREPGTDAVSAVRALLSARR